MRYLIFILLLACTPTKELIAPARLVHCWKDVLLPDGDYGGWWKIISQPEGSLPIALPAKGTPGADNPCIDLNDYGCGMYRVRYYVESTTCFNCIDSATVDIINNGSSIGFSICN